MTALKNEYFKQIIALYTYKYAALIFEKKKCNKNVCVAFLHI